MDITFKQLQIFQAVVVAGSITKASRRIGLSQPSISQQLAKLEEKLDAQLILRNRTGSIKLTPSGEYWFKASTDLLGQIEGMVDEHRRRFLQNTVTWQMGVTPTLRGRFVAAAARIAARQPGFVKFEIKYAVTSTELVQQLRLHQLNCAIVSEDAIADERSSFAIVKLFEDQVAWLVPASVPLVDIKHAMSKERPQKLAGALNYFVEIDGNVSLRTKSDDWFRHNLPGATATFSAMTYTAAVDIVAEGLATTHCPLSLLPNLPADVRERLQIFPVPNLSRSIVLAMPKHLMSLRPYAEIFREIEVFCKTEYTQEMIPQEAQAFPMVG
jgi:DNA-binding transcriptional LysR family regulator